MHHSCNDLFSNVSFRTRKRASLSSSEVLRYVSVRVGQSVSARCCLGICGLEQFYEMELRNRLLSPTTFYLLRYRRMSATIPHKNPFLQLFPLSKISTSHVALLCYSPISTVTTALFIIFFYLEKEYIMNIF